MEQTEYLVIMIKNKYWFTSLISAKRGLCDFSGGRGIIEDLSHADPYSVDIKVVDQEELDRIRKIYLRIN